jgi:hypothetical protein
LTAATYAIKIQDSVSGCAKDTSIVLTAPSCPTCTTPSVGGTTSTTATLPMCSTANAGVITLAGQTGMVIKWQTSTNSGGTWTDIANTSTTLNFTNAANGQQYRAVVNAGGICVDANSTATTITTSLTGCATDCNVPLPTLNSH